MVWLCACLLGAACGGDKAAPLPVEGPEAPAGEPDTGGGSKEDEGPEADSGTPDAGAPDSGTLAWVHTLTGRLEEDIRELRVHPEGHVVMVGTYTSSEQAVLAGTSLPDMSPLPQEMDQPGTDMVIAAYRPDGSPLWRHTYGARDSGLRPTGAAMDGTGALFVTGLYWGRADLALGASELTGGLGFFLMKLSAEGSRTEWVRLASTGASTYQAPLLSVRGGQLTWALSFFDHLQVGTERITVRERSAAILLSRLDTGSGETVDTHFIDSPEGSVDASALALGPGGSVHLGVLARGGFRVGGQLLQPSHDTHVLVKLDSGLRYQWHKAFVEDRDAPYATNPLSLAVDEAGEVFVAGSAHGTLRFAGRDYTADSPWQNPAYLARLGPAGEERWVRTLESEEPLALSSPRVLRLELWRDGELALAFIHSVTTRLCGAESPVATNNTDINGSAMLVTLDKEGRCRWAHPLTAESLHDAPSLHAAQGPGGAVYLGGTIEGAWPFPVSAGQPVCYRPGLLCTSRRDGFVLRLDR